MVEFGAPMYETLKISESMGIDFVCNTDHSYDFDEKIVSCFESNQSIIQSVNVLHLARTHQKLPAHRFN